MSKAFSALLWKESREALPQALAIGGVFALMLFWIVASPGAINDDSDPALRFKWLALLGGLAAVSIGYWQTSRERNPDMWALAVHRPASGAQIFGAKLLVGIGAVIGMMWVPYVLALWRLSVAGGHAAPFDRSYWLVGVANVFTAVMCYASGLYIGTRPAMSATRVIGAAVALAGYMAVSVISSIGMAVGTCLAIIIVMVSAAWSNFMSGPDSGAKPWSGRASTT